MKPKSDNTKLGVIVLTGIYIVVVAGLIIIGATMMENSHITFLEAFDGITTRLASKGVAAFAPFNSDCMKWIGMFTLVYLCACAYIYVNEKKHQRENDGNEQGSAEWNKDIKGYNKKYTYPYGEGNRKYENNVILSDEIFMGLDGRKTQRNINTLVIGGSGAGKSRFYVKPNILQAGYTDTSFVVTDPSGELLESCGKFLLNKGYKVKVLNLTDMEHSFCYNPFDYIREPEDILILINCIIKNTTPEGESSADPFWEKAEIALYQSLFFYLWQHRPKAEQNFTSVMTLLRAANVDENNSSAESPLDKIFNKIGKADPNDMGYKSYQTFRMAAGRTLKSILISAAVRLNSFEIPAVASMVRHDYEHPEKNIDLDMVGHEKTALFCIIPSADDTYNFIVAMMYYQLFSCLYYSYDHDKKPLKYPVRFMLDEFANIGQIPDFDKKLATMRKYQISCSIILQNLKQLEEMYDKKAEPLIGNCDEILFLGSSEQSTLEYISKKLGKTTIHVKNYSHSKGAKGSASQSINQTGRELMTPEEVGLMPTKDCILFIRGERPFYGLKYRYEKHPNYKLTGDFSDEYKYVIEDEFDALLENTDAVNYVEESNNDEVEKVVERNMPQEEKIAEKVTEDRKETEIVKEKKADKAKKDEKNAPAKANENAEKIITNSAMVAESVAVTESAIEEEETSKKNAEVESESARDKVEKIKQEKEWKRVEKTKYDQAEKAVKDNNIKTVAVLDDDMEEIFVKNKSFESDFSNQPSPFAAAAKKKKAESQQVDIKKNIPANTGSMNDITDIFEEDAKNDDWGFSNNDL